MTKLLTTVALLAALATPALAQMRPGESPQEMLERFASVAVYQELCNPSERLSNTSTQYMIGVVRRYPEAMRTEAGRVMIELAKKNPDAFCAMGDVSILPGIKGMNEAVRSSRY